MDIWKMLLGEENETPQEKAPAQDIELDEEMEREIRKSYENTKEDMREGLFYGDYESARSILARVADALEPLPAELRADLALQIYVQVWIRCRASFGNKFSSPAYIREALARRFDFAPEDQVAAAVDRALDCVYEHEPQIRQRGEMLDFMAQQVQNHARGNVAIQDAFLEDPEYGLVPEKPVFVDGFGSDREYLGHLRTLDGQSLRYERHGSRPVEGISGPVDIYSLYRPDGSEYMQIFLCVYGTRNTGHAPAGLRYEEE